MFPTKEEKRKAKDAAAFEILKAIKNGQPYPKQNRILAPLSQANLIEIRYSGGWRIAGAVLTSWGEAWLRVKMRETP